MDVLCLKVSKCYWVMDMRHDYNRFSLLIQRMFHANALARTVVKL
jgi:hypothetical protein